MVLKLFGPKYISGAFLARTLSKSFSKSTKVFRIVLQYFGDCSVKSSSKGLEAEHSMIFFWGGGHQTKHIFYSQAVLLGFCNVSISCHFNNCQGLSNLLGSILAVRLNELETALIYNNLKIKLILR